MMSLFRIYCPTKTAMQSGKAKSSDHPNQQPNEWIGEFTLSQAQRPDNLMGWQGSADTQKQVVLRFVSVEQAIEYAKNNDLDYIVEYPKTKKIKPKAYSDNFNYHRQMPWTH